MYKKYFILIVGIFVFFFCPRYALAQNDQNIIINPTLQTIYQRKSVRSFTDQSVNKDILETLVKAGMAAPTAMDKRPWAFVIITDTATLTKLGEMNPDVSMTKTAQAAIVVCGVSEKFMEGLAKEYWVQDVSAATENILLAAESLGLGAVWTGAYPIEERVAQIRTILNIPQNIIPLAMIPIGYPAGDPLPKNKFDSNNIHWEKW